MLQRLIQNSIHHDLDLKVMTEQTVIFWFDLVVSLFYVLLNWDVHSSIWFRCYWSWTFLKGFLNNHLTLRIAVFLLPWNKPFISTEEVGPLYLLFCYLLGLMHHDWPVFSLLKGFGFHSLKDHTQKAYNSLLLPWCYLIHRRVNAQAYRGSSPGAWWREKGPSALGEEDFFLLTFFCLSRFHARTIRIIKVFLFGYKWKHENIWRPSTSNKMICSIFIKKKKKIKKIKIKCGM